MRAMDVLYAFPAILLAIAVGASLGPGLTNTVIAVTIVFIPPRLHVSRNPRPGGWSPASTSRPPA